MKQSKKTMARITLLLSSAIITSGCMDTILSQDQQALISSLNERVGFSECKVASGLSILKPAKSNSLTRQTLYLSTVQENGHKYASLSVDGFRPLSYTYNVKGIGNDLSGTLSLTLTNSDEIYLYTKDVNGVPDVTEPCIFKKPPAITVSNEEIEYGPWSNYLVSGMTFKARTVSVNEHPYHVGYQVGKLESGRNSPAKFIEYGFERGDKNTIISGITKEALKKKISENWISNTH